MRHFQCYSWYCCCLVIYICGSVDFVWTCISFLLPSFELIFPLAKLREVRERWLIFLVLLLFEARSRLNHQVVFWLQTYSFTKAHWFNIFAGNCHWIYLFFFMHTLTKRWRHTLTNLKGTEGFFSFIFFPERGTWLSATEQTFILSREGWKYWGMKCLSSNVPTLSGVAAGEEIFLCLPFKPLKRQCKKIVHFKSGRNMRMANSQDDSFF